MNGKLRAIAVIDHRFPGRNLLVGWIVFSLTFCPGFPGGQAPTLPLAQMALASGEYGDDGYGDDGYGGGENYDTSMGGPGYDYHSQDSDGDGWSDEDENNAGTDAHNPASYPGAVDPAEMDSDGDGLTDDQENSGFEIEVEVWVEDEFGSYNEDTGSVGFWMPFTEWVYPDPEKADSDGDLLPDGWEVSTPGFNPTSAADGLADADLDGLGRGMEWLLGTDWKNPDSDWDGFPDGVEVLELGTDPVDPSDPLPAEEPAEEPAGDSGAGGGGGNPGGEESGGEEGGGGTQGGGAGGTGGTQSGAGGDGESPGGEAPQGGGASPVYALEVKGVQLDWYGGADADGCTVIDEILEYEHGGEGEITGVVVLVTCSCEGVPHRWDEHAHTGGGLFASAGGSVSSLDGGNNNEYEEYGPLVADFEFRTAAAGGGAEVELPLVGGSGLGAWGGPALTTAFASVSGRDVEGGVTQASGQRILVRMAADQAVESAVSKNYLSLHRKRAKGTVEWEVVDVQTVNLHIPEGRVNSENAALLAPPLEEGVTHQVTLIPVEIVPDYNRDGRIDDQDRGKVSKDNPWRWWVNDDNDSGEYDASADRPDVPEGTPYGQRDYQDDKVDGIRDLVDFFPLHLDLQQVMQVFPSSEYQYFLRQESPTGPTSLGALWYPPVHLDRDPKALYSVGGFLKNLDQAADMELRSVEDVTSDGVKIPQTLLDAASGGRGVVLIEGKFIGHEPLIVEIRSNGGASMAEIEFPLKIAKVEEMYRHVDLRTVPLNPDGSDAGSVPSALPTKTGDPGYPYPDKLTNGKYFVFVHGYNVNEVKARGWFAELFKRLHQMGSKARFVGVSWRGDAGLGGIDLPPDNFFELEQNANYHKPVFFALQTGDALKGALSFTGKDNVTIAAHSLGNMVVSHAIADGGFSPSRYYMIDAAVAAEAYDSASTQTQRYHMLEKDWKPQLGVIGGSLKATSARWYDLFDSGDGRSDLKWVDRFAKVVLKAYHFYSTGEEVLQNPEPGEDSAEFHVARANGFSRGSWVSQEFAKGTFYVASTTQDFDGVGLGTRQAGWGFAEQYVEDRIKLVAVPPMPIPVPVPYKVNVPPNPVEVAALSGDRLRYDPIFRDFMVKDLTDPTLGSALANNKLVKYHVLASGIPALSYAAGSNPIEGEGMEGKNFNMPGLFQTPGSQWPSEGHEDEKSSGKWLHSDFYGVSLSHVYLMYEKMIELGGLDDEKEN